MKNTIGFTLRMLGAVACLGAAGLGYAEDMSHATYGKTEQWFISSPTVNSRAWKNYSGQIVIYPGDSVYVTAGGCVQTGGSGLTWKRYVDPQGPNSDRLYHGVFALPGVYVTTFESWMQPVSPGSDVWQGHYWVPAGEAVGTLWLVYQDDAYGDNGYYAHDNGTGDQCKNVGNAWVSLTVVHQ
jgi:hypothetical protein